MAILLNAIMLHLRYIVTWNRQVADGRWSPAFTGTVYKRTLMATTGPTKTVISTIQAKVRYAYASIFACWKLYQCIERMVRLYA